MAEAEFSTLYYTLVYTENDDVFTTLIPILEPTSFNSKNPIPS